MARRAATTEAIVDPEVPFDPELDDDGDEGTVSPSLPVSIPQVFMTNTSEPSAVVTKRGISVTVKRHQGSDKNQGPLLNTTVEVTLSEEGPMDFARQLKTAQLLCNEAHDIVGGALGIDTIERDGWVSFGLTAPAPFPQQALQQAPQQPQYAPQPQQYQQAPQQSYNGGGQQGGQRREPNYDDHSKNALSQLFYQQPHLFQVEQKTFPDGKTKTGLTPTPAAFQAVGMVVPNPIKKLWL